MSVRSLLNSRTGVVASLALALAAGLGVGYGAVHLASSPRALPPQDSLIRSYTLPAVYYYAADGNRYVFPNDKTFGSWFVNFDQVRWVADDVLADIPLKGNVTYRPGVRLVKIQSSPKVYAVDRGGTLHWVSNEAIAAALYGADWNKKIDDVPDAFFTNYTTGDPLLTIDRYDPLALLGSIRTINENMSLPATAAAPRATTALGTPTMIPGPDGAPLAALLPSAPPPTSTPLVAMPTSTPVAETPASVYVPRVSAPSPSAPTIPTATTTTSTSYVPRATTGLGPELKQFSVISLGIDSFAVYWETSSPATTKIQWGKNRPNEYELGTKDYTGGYTTSHTATIDGLAPGTRYYYRITSQLQNGGFTIRDEEIVTKSAPVGAPLVSWNWVGSTVLNPPAMGSGVLIENSTAAGVTQTFNVYVQKPGASSFTKYSFTKAYSTPYANGRAQWAFDLETRTEPPGEYRYYATVVDSKGVESAPSETKTAVLRQGPTATPTSGAVISSLGTITLTPTSGVINPTYWVFVYKSTTQLVWSWSGSSPTITYDGPALATSGNPHRLITYVTGGFPTGEASAFTATSFTIGEPTPPALRFNLKSMTPNSPAPINTPINFVLEITNVGGSPSATAPTVTIDQPTTNLASTCTAPLAPGATCTVNFTMTYNTSGDKVFTVGVSPNGSGGSISFGIVSPTASCTDSDGGINAAVAGYGKGPYGSGQSGGLIFGEGYVNGFRQDSSLGQDSIFYDHCPTPTQLNEAFCQGTTLSSYGYYCPTGCLNGVCAPPPSTTSTSTAFGVFEPLVSTFRSLLAGLF